jgi:ethanolamine transporter EutH
MTRRPRTPATVLRQLGRLGRVVVALMSLGAVATLVTLALACLKSSGATTPAEVGRRLGLSESAAASLLSSLARELYFML